MNKTWKRWGALLLALVMALSLFPASALAARVDEEAEIPPEGADTGLYAAPVVTEDDAPATLLENTDTSDDVTATDESRDIDRTTYTLTVSSENSTTHATEGPKDYAKDNLMNTFWHSNMATNESGRWIAVELPEAQWVSALRYRPRSDYTSANSNATATVNGNGYVTSYRVEVSQNGTDWTSVASGDWAAFENVDGRGMLPTGAWEVVNFDAVQTKYIRLVGVHTAGNGNTDQYMHAAEIRVVAAPAATTYTVSGTVVDGGNGDAPLSGAVVNIGGTTATTDENGAYSVAVRAGTYNIVVTLDGYEVTGGGSVTVTGADVTGHTIQMQQVSRKITGTVTDGTDGLVGVAVTLVQAAAPYTTMSGVSAVTGEDGTFEMNVNSLAAGSYKVRAAKTGYGAAIGGTAVNVTTDSPTATFVGGTVALTAIGQADYSYDMTTQLPAFTTGASTAFNQEGGERVIRFNGTSHSANQVRLTGINAADVTVEFDATRSGTSTTAGFGVALRHTDANNYLYVGQSAGNNWYSAGVSGGNSGSSTALSGPSFLPGDTRHFKVTLAQDNGTAKVSLWIDGVQVIDNANAGNGHCPATAGAVAFVCGGNNTTVTVKDLYITRTDSKYTITMPDTLTAYVFGSDTSLPAGGTAGTFLASEGDVVNVYSANPATKQMAAPLTVRKTEDNTVVSTEKILHVTHNSSAYKERGYYVQFRMPACNVTLESALKSYLEGVTLEKNGESGVFTAAVTPAGATASFQWFREGTAENTWTLIEGATNATYTPQSADAGYNLKVEAAGTGSWSGVVSATTEETVTNAITGVSILRTTSANEVVDVGGSTVLRATITPAQGVDLAVTWSVDPADVVQVEALPEARKDPNMDAAYSTATITGLKAGEATITITTSNGLTDTRKVTVGKAVTNVIFGETGEFTLYTNPAMAEQSSTKTLVPTVNPSDATNKAVTWWSTDETVATVDQTGLVTAVAPGTAEIYVRSQQKPDLKAYRTVRVVTLPESLTLDVEEVELILRPGSAPGTQVVVPTLAPADTSDKTIRWTTDNSAVATVTKPWAADTGSQNALITAQGVGETTITATSAANETLVKTVHVTVKQQIVGQAAVSGELKFGSELTADVNDIAEAAKNDLTYAWYRGETATGTPLATTKTYTPVKEDIGFVLTVKITAGGDYIGETTYTTGTITKADGPIITGAGASGIHGEPATAAGNDGKIVGFPADDGNTYEVKPVDAPDSAYQEVTGTETTGLAPGDYNVRIAETDTHKAGTPITVTVAPHDVTLHLINIGTMTPAGAGTVTRRRGQAEEGEERVLTVRPAEGYQLKENGLTVTGDISHETVQLTKGEPVTEDGKTYETYTFIMPGEAVTVTAEFELKTYTIGHALNNITCSMGAEENHTATHGTPFSITLTPDAGYEMPRSLTVTATGSGQRFTDYTYTADPNNAEARVLNFAHGVTQDVTVRGDGVLKTFPVEYVRERVSFLSAPARAGWHQGFVAAVTPDDGYQLPDTITVTMGGQSFADFTYTKETGAIYIAEGIVEGALTVTVRGEQKILPLEKVSISGIAKVGERLTANITPAEADGHVVYQWCWATLNGDGTVASVEEIEGATGRSRAITELSEGKNIVMKVTAVEGGGFSGTVLSQPTGVVVAADADGVMPVNVEIVRPSVSIDVGGTDTLVAYVTPSNATNKTVLWESSDPEVVTVENGVITGVAPGTATITVTAEADARLSDTCIVTVNGLQAVQATAEDVVAPYDGLAHSIQVFVTDPVDGSASVTYSSDGVNFHSSNPTFSAVGEHMVWYKVTASGRAGVQGQAKVTIEKAVPEIKITANRSTLSGAGEVILTVTLPDYADRTGFYVEASDLMLPIVRNEDGTYTVELPGDRKTYTFTVTLLGTDNYEQTTATCNVRVGMSSGMIEPPTTTTETNPDGSTTTTVTKPDGTVTETTEKTDGTVEAIETKPDGTVTETVTAPDGAKTEKVTDPEKNVEITVTDPEGETLAEVKLPAVIAEPETRFEDVPEGHWADEGIHNMAALKAVNGVGNNQFDMNSGMTRGDLATILHRISNKPAGGDVNFADVDNGKYYAEGVAWAAKTGVVTGFSKDTYKPEQIITREQMALMLMRYAKLLGMDVTADAAELDVFTDGANTHDWAVEGVAWCVKNGILQGKGGAALDPTSNVTRAQVAVMLDRFVALMK